MATKKSKPPKSPAAPAHLPATVARSALRRDIGRMACYEVQAVARMLHAYIEAHDSTGDLAPCMRGGLLRLSALSDVLYEAVVTDDPDESDLELLNRMGGIELRQSPSGPRW